MTYQINLLNELKNILESNIEYNLKRVKIKKHMPLAVDNRNWEFSLDDNDRLFIQTKSAHNDMPDYIFDNNSRFGSYNWSYTLRAYKSTDDAIKNIVSNTLDEINYLFIKFISK